MNEEIEKTIRNLTERQAALVKVVLLKGPVPSGASGLSGHGLGRVASSLQEQGVIEPLGRSGRQKKWTATPDWQKTWSENRKEIEKILDQIIGT
ncbi:MAG: hypothetical protein Q8N84_02510 [bacterium]|nr:hypothetical protein [bacterium]